MHRNHQDQALVNTMIMALVRGEARDHGEISLTKLAEIAALDHDHPEWLDDPDHEVWDLAVEVSDIWESQPC